MQQRPVSAGRPAAHAVRNRPEGRPRRRCRHSSERAGNAATARALSPRARSGAGRRPPAVRSPSSGTSRSAQRGRQAAPVPARPRSSSPRNSGSPSPTGPWPAGSSCTRASVSCACRGSGARRSRSRSGRSSSTRARNWPRPERRPAAAVSAGRSTRSSRYLDEVRAAAHGASAPGGSVETYHACTQRMSREFQDLEDADTPALEQALRKLGLSEFLPSPAAPWRTTHATTRRSATRPRPGGTRYQPGGLTPHPSHPLPARRATCVPRPARWGSRGRPPGVRFQAATVNALCPGPVVRAWSRHGPSVDG